MIHPSSPAIKSNLALMLLQ